jgi:four helix bundle protein
MVTMSEVGITQVKMDSNAQQPGAVPGPGAASGSGPAAGTGGSVTVVDLPLFDHEKLEVYQVAREFLMLATGVLARKMPRDLRDQFDRATSSILFNIGEGAGKTARADKQRSYKIARGSTTEAATQLDVMHIRGFITSAQYQMARALLVRVAQMLSRLCGAPRRT